MNKGFKIQVEDSKGSTPLHWACYSGSESSVNSLLAWGSEIDSQDKIYGKIVKKMLIRGANRNIAVRIMLHRILEENYH
jgi:ankyrin repeat protein